MSLNAKQTDKKINKAILSDNVYIFNYLLINLLENNPEYILSGKDYENQDTLLMRSCRHSSKKIVDYLLERKVNIDKQKTNSGTTALLLASQEGHYEIVKLLLQNGANCNVRDNNGLSPIHLPAQNGHYEIVKLLLEYGANCNVQANNGVSPIQQSAQNGHYEIVKLLLEYGANCNIQSNSGISSIQQAAQQGHYEIVKLLLQNGANCNVQDNDGLSSIKQAAQQGHYEIVKLLLQNGANCNVQDNNGFSPIRQAAQNGHYEIVKLLLQNGANCPLNPNPKIYNKKVMKIFTQHQQTKKLITSTLPMLALSRHFCEDSLFHEDYLPRDLFTVIATCIKNEIELRTYYLP